MNGYLQIECLSDTCFSMPLARSAATDINSAQDALGLPAVSGKTIHGLLRDTYLSAAAILDPDQHGHALLGKPRSLDPDGVLRIGDAYLVNDTGEDLRPFIRHLLHDKQKRGSPLPPSALGAAFFRTRTLTAEDRTSGAPRKETLRVLQVIPRGTKLKVSLQTTRPLSEPEAQLLGLLAGLTRHAGLVRNRGMGLVRLSIVWEENTLRCDAIFSPVSSLPVFFLHYRLHLTAPCLIPDQDIDPNSRLTRPYLPGSTLRGAVAAALIARQVAPPLLQTILGSGLVDFLNAYPEAGMERSLPTPVSWRRVKNAALADTDRSARPHDALASLLLPRRAASAEDTSAEDTHAEEMDKEVDVREDVEPRSEQMQSVQTPFFAAGHRGYFTRPIPRRVTNHQRRHRRSGATGKGGQETVFVYEALEEQQSFRGCIAVRSAEEREEILALLAGVLQHQPLWIGGSLRSGYGAAPQVDILLAVNPEAEVDLAPRDVEKGASFIVRLASDAVLRNPQTGQHDPWHLHQALQERFSGAAEVEGALVQPTTARGFSRLWRTELPGIPAAAAGSDARLCASRNLSHAELLRLQAEPIGERTMDGFGRILIAAEEDALALTLEWSAPPSNPYEMQLQSLATLRAAQRRVYATRLLSLMSALALEAAERVNPLLLPSVHLLQRLRAPLRRAALEDDLPAEYALWLSSNSHTTERLRERQRRAVNSVWLGNGSLGDLLRNAAERGWELPRSAGEDEERTRYRLLPDAEAESIWDEVRAEPVLRRHYLNVLLSALADRKQQPIEWPTEQPQSEG